MVCDNPRRCRARQPCSALRKHRSHRQPRPPVFRAGAHLRAGRRLPDARRRAHSQPHEGRLRDLRRRQAADDRGGRVRHLRRARRRPRVDALGARGPGARLRSPLPRRDLRHRSRGVRPAALAVDARGSPGLPRKPGRSARSRRADHDRSSVDRPRARTADPVDRGRDQHTRMAAREAAGSRRRCSTGAAWTGCRRASAPTKPTASWKTSSSSSRRCATIAPTSCSSRPAWPACPRIPTGAEQRPLTSMLPPKMGLVNGRIQRVPQATDMHDRMCKAEGHRLADTDFDRRFGELVAAARAANVVVLPGGDADAGAADARRRARVDHGRAGIAAPAAAAGQPGADDAPRPRARHRRPPGDGRRRARRIPARRLRHGPALPARLLHDQQQARRQGAVDPGAVEAVRQRDPVAALLSRAGGKENVEHARPRSRPGESIGPPPPVADGARHVEPPAIVDAVLHLRRASPGTR